MRSRRYARYVAYMKIISVDHPTPVVCGNGFWGGVHVGRGVSSC